MVDDRLRLMFTCCHPALAPNAQVALTLRLIAGLQTPEVARAFLVPEATMALRLVRARNEIEAAKIPDRVPADADLPAQLKPILAVIDLVFDEGYVAHVRGDDLTRADLCAEAIRLARLLVELMPDEPEVHGLPALLLPSSPAGPPAPTQGRLVRLADQDRARWDRESSPRARPSSGRSCAATCRGRTRSRLRSPPCTAGGTDWAQVVALYDLLLSMTPTPIVP